VDAPNMLMGSQFNIDKLVSWTFFIS
jgi:hypothetical protein